MSPLAYEITTPENVSFRLERAGLASRGCAWLIDVAIMGGLLQGTALLLSPLQWFSGSAATVLLLVIGFLVQWWYAALCEWRLHGRTCGKWLLGIATRDQSGLRLSFPQSLVRNLLRVIDWLPGLYLVGGLSALLDRHGRRLGDLAAGTIVVRERRHSLPSRTVEASRAGGLPLHPEILEVVRQLNALEREAALVLCEDRDRMPLALRLGLFEEFSRHLERRFGYCRPEHLSAENLVLFAVTALRAPPTKKLNAAAAHES